MVFGEGSSRDSTRSRIASRTARGLLRRISPCIGAGEFRTRYSIYRCSLGFGLWKARTICRRMSNAIGSLRASHTLSWAVTSMRIGVPISRCWSMTKAWTGLKARAIMMTLSSVGARICGSDLQPQPVISSLHYHSVRYRGL